MRGCIEPITNRNAKCEALALDEHRHLQQTDVADIRALVGAQSVEGVNGSLTQTRVSLNPPYPRVRIE